MESRSPNYLVPQTIGHGFHCNNAEFKAKVSYLGEEFSFSLSGDELEGKVVFAQNLLYFKVIDRNQHVLHVQLAGSSLYKKSSGVYNADFHLPLQCDQIEESSAVITFYNPNERPLTESSKKNRDRWRSGGEQFN